MTIRWGLLGSGNMARQFASDVLADGGAIAAVGARKRKDAENLAVAFGTRAHQGYQALVADDAVDAVYVSTLNPFHYAHAMLALAAGKHVLVEKPFAMSQVEACGIFDEAERRGLVAMEGMWTRYLPQMVECRRLMSEGAIGEPRCVLADLSTPEPRTPNSRLRDPAKGGGATYDVGPYALSLAVETLGSPDRLGAIVRIGPTGVDEEATIVLGFASNRSAVLHLSIDVHGPQGATILGEDGRIDLAAPWHRPTRLTVYSRAGKERAHFNGSVPGIGLQFEAREMERRVRSQAGETDDAGRTIAVMGLIEAVLRAGSSTPGVSSGNVPHQLRL